MALNPRKRFLIDPKFQLSFAVHAVSGTVLVLLVFFAAHWLSFWRFKKLGVEMGLPADHIYFRFLSDQISTLSMVFLVTSFIVIGLAVLWAILFSHKIAGPIQRLCNEALEMRKADRLLEIKARRGDYFPQLQKTFNEIIRSTRPDG